MTKRKGIGYYDLRKCQEVFRRKSRKAEKRVVMAGGEGWWIYHLVAVTRSKGNVMEFQKKGSSVFRPAVKERGNWGTTIRRGPVSKPAERGNRKKNILLSCGELTYFLCERRGGCKAGRHGQCVTKWAPFTEDEKKKKPAFGDEQRCRKHCGRPTEKGLRKSGDWLR